MPWKQSMKSWQESYNIRIQEFLSATKQDFAAKKDLALTVDINLRTTFFISAHQSFSSS